MLRTEQPAGAAWVRAFRGRTAAFWALTALLLAAFAMGGSARADVASLMVLRPLAILMLGFGLSQLHWAHVESRKFLFLMAAALAALPLFHLVPLPVSWWTALPGRGLIGEIDQAAGLGAVARPLSMVPDATSNALFACVVPLAVLVLGAQLEEAELAQLPAVVLALGMVSAILGLGQITGERGGPLYLYWLTNENAPAGLFANSNHHAMFLAALLPLLVLAGLSKPPRSFETIWPIAIVSLGVAIVVPLILATGSRMGLITGGIGLAGLPLMFATRMQAEQSLPRRGKNRMKGIVPLIGIATGIAALSLWYGQSTALQRLIGTDTTTEIRFQLLPTLLTMINTYFPWGSGVGSFEKVYQIAEPDQLLAPITMNHAHNDWLEVVITSGASAAVLLVAALVGFIMAAWGASRTRGEHRTRCLVGLTIVLLFAVASWSDYPLRVPSLACLFVLACLWASNTKTVNLASTETRATQAAAG